MWTAPYHGVQHLGEHSTRRCWATVEDHGSFALLFRWFPGCGFQPHESTHTTAHEARTAGEAWIKNGGA